MPRDIVRNEDRWKEVQIDSGSGEDVPDSSSSSARIGSPSKYFQTLVKRHKDTAKQEKTSKRWLNY